MCRSFLFDTSDLTLSRKIWLVSEMIVQEVVEQSAVTKQVPDNIPVRDSIILFPKTLFQGIILSCRIFNTMKIIFLVLKAENGSLRRSDAKPLMPPQIKYEVVTPTKVGNLTLHFFHVICREMNEDQNGIHPNSSPRKSFLLTTGMRMKTTPIRITNKMLKTKTLKSQH